MTDKTKPKRPLRIILDILSLKDDYSELIMRYEDNEFFEFIAVGGSSKFTELKIDFENKSMSFEKDFPVNHQHIREELAFPLTEEVIAELASNWDLKPEELKLLFIVQFMITNPQDGPKVIMVTERKKIL